MLYPFSQLLDKVNAHIETLDYAHEPMNLYEPVKYILSLGGKGVISVLSNIMPRATQKMCEDYMSGNTEAARKAQLSLLPLINALFCEVNPIPVKAAVAAMGYCENYLRLPLTPMEPEHEAKLLALMKEHNLI